MTPVAVTQLELLAGLIASLAENLEGWEVLECQIMSPSLLVTLNKVVLAHMLLCVTAGKPESRSEVTFRVKNEW